MIIYAAGLYALHAFFAVVALAIPKQYLPAGYKKHTAAVELAWLTPVYGRVFGWW